MNQEQATVWNDYMVKIAQYDLGQEMGDQEAISKREALVKELRVKLTELGYK